MKKKILIRGPVLSQSGYGEQARFALRALRSREDLFDIFIQAIPWGQTGWIWGQSEFRSWVDERIRVTQILLAQKQLAPDISLQITIPNEWHKMCPINIGYTAGIETTMVSPGWLEKGNMMDKILVVSNHAKTTYQNTTAQAKDPKTGEVFPYNLKSPIEVVWETTQKADPEPLEHLNLDYNFNYLCVSQFGPRKNFENTIRWFVEEFIDQKVGLVVKTSLKSNCLVDFNETKKALKNILSNYPERKCKVYLLHGDLTDGQMTTLYTHDKIKALINIAHGEGFGLPLFEAARHGLPIITTEWSGQVDFLNHDGKNYFEPVDFTLQPVQAHAIWKGVIEKDSMWAYADQGSYKMALRKVRKNWKTRKNWATKLQALVEDKFNEEKLFAGFVTSIYGEQVDVDSWLKELQEETA